MLVPSSDVRMLPEGNGTKLKWEVNATVSDEEKFRGGMKYFYDTFTAIIAAKCSKSA